MTDGTSRQRFGADMTMTRVVELHPKARWVLAAYHFGSCAHCHLSEGETLGEAAASYGIAIEKLLADLNSLFAEHPETRNG